MEEVELLARTHFLAESNPHALWINAVVQGFGCSTASAFREIQIGSQ